ncbi:MAG: twin-arginine translocase TatA/TatE family subunit [Nitrospinae bacterium]|nr:twin-arginine translocase TatA/TatE family subunit [Nitrospinota bacterium]
MGSFSLMHWIIVLFIVMIVFGAKRLPQIGSGLGEGIRNFKKSIGQDDQLEAKDEEAKPEKTKEKVG